MCVQSGNLKWSLYFSVEISNYSLFDLILILEYDFSTMMPHTGVNPRFICLDNGTFILNGTQEEVPVCVPKTSCRLPEFPNDIADTWGYEHNNTEKGKL